MDIPLDIEGTVTNSKKVGHTIKVIDDSDSTGGYLIFQWWRNSNGPNENFAFDSWVEDLSSLEQFFVESGWVVQWHA
jgi:hypothetical protein